MIQPERAALAVTYNMHGGEPIGERVAQLLYGSPDIYLLDLNRIAAAAGRRYVGKAGELGGHFPGNFYSDNPEDQLAAWATQKLEKLPLRHPIADLHSTELVNAEHTLTGRLVTEEGLAIASLLDRKVVQWMPDYGFHGSFPNAVSIETSVTNSLDLEPKAQELAQRIRTIAEMGSVGLREHFKQHGTEGMTFYKRFADIMLVNPDGTPNTRVLKVLDELEEIEIRKRYDEVAITPRVASALNIQPGTFAANTWGHGNVSKPLGHAQTTATGVRRRECFGDLLIAVDPPKEIGNGLYYFFLAEPEARPAAMRWSGITGSR